MVVKLVVSNIKRKCRSYNNKQVGVGVPGGCEAVPHTVAAVLEALGNSNGKCMLKVDYENAFNLFESEFEI